MHSKEKGNRTKEQKDRQCVLVAGEGVVSPARTHVSAAIWPYAGAGNNNFRGVLRSRSPETRGHRTANVSLSRPACTLVRAMLLLLLAVVVSICNGENT